MSTRWRTQYLHSICHPSSSTAISPPPYTHSASSSTHSLPLHLTSVPSPSPPASTPFPPPPPPAVTSVAPAPAPTSASVPPSNPPSKGYLFDPDILTTSRLRHRASSGALSRLRSHSSSSLRSRGLPPETIPSPEAPTSVPVMTERPAIYVHFEFGVSWTPRQPPKNRQITYMSRSMRDRGNQFPRQLPAPNTNYLADAQSQAFPVAQPQYEQQQYQLQYQLQNVPRQIEYQPSRFPRDVVAIMPPENAGSISPGQQQLNAQIQRQWETLLPRRTSRSQSRSSHERGRSAPPPFNESPWDANPGSSSTNNMSHNLPRDQRPDTGPEIWKDLPATPNQFRLGEDDMPWSSWTFPMGYADDDNVTNDEVQETRQQSPPQQDAGTWLGSSRRPEASDRDKGKAREMQSLAAALVTVDNGFEDQWWYQGPRLVHVGGKIVEPAGDPSRHDTHDFDQDFDYDGPAGTVGWVVSPQDTPSPLRRSEQDHEVVHPSWTSFQAMTPRTSIVDMVSPVSEFASPVPSFHGLQRSLTTRSDELHM